MKAGDGGIPQDDVVRGVRSDSAHLALVNDSARFVPTLAFDVYRDLWDHVHERPWSEDA
jgi:hypothetical protein